MTATVIRGDALHLPLADASVDLVCTSPPYFGLRSYTDGGQHYDGQLGSEPTPLEYVDALIAATAEMIRVLKPSGSIWVNLGDKYVSSPPGNERSLANSAEHQRKGKESYDRNWRMPEGMRQKSLMGIPWRYAIRCIDDLGLILRAEIIWSKPNGLPESVTDRVRRSHEQWFHMVKQPRYYSAVDEIREDHSPNRHDGGDRSKWTNGKYDEKATAKINSGPNPLGKLPGSVWTVPTEPLQVPPELGVDHFAAYPTEWPRRIIQGWTPIGICLECGEGRRPVATDRGLEQGTRGGALAAEITAKYNTGHRHGHGNSTLGFQRIRTITGYVCACTPHTDHPGTGESWDQGRGRTDGRRNHPERDEFGNRPLGPKPSSREYHHDQWTPAPTRPAVVLDPFGGTGTTALVADVLGRHGISVDLSADYSHRLAKWRTTNPDQRARAAQVAKPPPVIDGQLDLLGELL